MIEPKATVFLRRVRRQQSGLPRQGDQFPAQGLRRAVRGLPDVILIRNDLVGDEGLHPIAQRDDVGWKFEVDHSMASFWIKGGRAFGKLDAACEQKRNGWREAFPQGVRTLSGAMKLDIEAGDRAQTIMRERLIPFHVEECRTAGLAICFDQIACGYRSDRPPTRMP